LISVATIEFARACYVLFATRQLQTLPARDG
jgi:hypothetical protein